MSEEEIKFEKKEVGDITDHVMKTLLKRQRISEPNKVYSAIMELREIPYLEEIRFEIGNLKLNSAGIGLILTANYTGNTILGGEMIESRSVEVTAPEIHKNISEIFDDLNEKTKLRFSAYDAHPNKNTCKAYLNFSDEERLDFVLMGK